MKCLNSKAKLTIQKLYEAMYHAPYMLKEGQYAKINNNPAYMPVIVEKAGHLHGYGEISSALPTTANKTAIQWPTLTWNSSS
jgi:hypothetical protein